MYCDYHWAPTFGGSYALEVDLSKGRAFAQSEIAYGHEKKDHTSLGEWRLNCGLSNPCFLLSDVDENAVK